MNRPRMIIDGKLMLFEGIGRKRNVDNMMKNPKPRLACNHKDNKPTCTDVVLLF